MTIFEIAGVFLLSMFFLVGIALLVLLWASGEIAKLQRFHDKENGVTDRIEATRATRPLERIIVRLRCWWFGCEPHPQDSAPPDEITCMHCYRNVPYGDMVGDTRHNRTIDWLRHWMWRRWVPAKCSACGTRFGHRGYCDGIPF